jgi:hypothetical protein
MEIQKSEVRTWKEDRYASGNIPSILKPGLKATPSGSLSLPIMQPLYGKWIQEDKI